MLYSVPIPAGTGRRTAGRFSLRNIFLLCSFLLLPAVFFPPSPAAAAGKTYTISVVPQFPPTIIKQMWMPMMERVSRDSGIKLELKFYKSIPDFEDGFLRGADDFVYLNPYHAIMARKAQGYTPFVRDGKDRLIGIIVVRGDSGINSVRDLDGKVVVFPAPNAFAASLYMRALFVNKEKIRFTAKYRKTHSNVYRHVALGKAAAGGGVNRTLSRESRELKDLLKVIYETPPVAPHPLCAHPRVASSVLRAVSRAFLALAEEKTGRDLLKTVGMTEPVPADYERDYRMLEELRLQEFIVKGGN